MIKLEITPLSVNKAWMGKRFKTPEYKKYETACLLLLPRFTMPPAPYSINITYLFSNKLSDIDNPTKCLLDILQKKYDFNDKEIYQLNLSKKIVGKGCEGIEIEILTHHPRE